MQWIHKQADPELVESMTSALRGDAKVGTSAPVLAPLLVHRGMTDPDSARRFLSPSLDHLHSPELMLGLGAAVDRLDAAIERKLSLIHI